MDPIYYQVNQTRLTENTQKGSDNLRIQHNKEAKKKAERSGELDASELSADISSMGEDLLGDMDPDDYGGRSGKQFAQMWREKMQEGEEEEEKPPSSSSQDEEQSPDDEPQDEHSAPPEEQDVSGVEPPPEAEAIEGTAVELPPPGTAAVAAGASAPTEPKPPAPSKEPSRASPSAEPTAKPARAEKAPETFVPTGSRRASAPEAPAASDSEKSPTESPAVATAAPSRPRGSLGPSSLLDFSSGFLIAEEAFWDTPEQAAPDEATAAEEIPIAEEISVLLERLVNGDVSDPSLRKLHTLLARFGRKVLQTCVDAGTKVYLLPPGEPLLAHPQLKNSGETDLVGAAYLPQSRLCLIEESCISQAPHGFHPAFFYFAHAYDHALGGESFASLKSPAVQASYQACLEGAHRFGDLMAAHSPAHYFAQAVESYLAENDCYEPLWTRQDLYDFDRSMYFYVEYLLR